MKKFVLLVVFMSVMIFACSKESAFVDPANDTSGMKQDSEAVSSGNDTTTTVPPALPIPGIPAERVDSIGQPVPPTPPVPVDPTPLPVDSDSLKYRLNFK